MVPPLRFNEVTQELCHHPDPARARFVLDGIRGFRTGFQSEHVVLQSATGNMKSAFEHPEVIDQYLANEVANHRVAGPFSSPPILFLHCSPFGVTPKKIQPGKWRLILDLSSSKSYSVNAGIPKEPFSIRYISVDTGIRVLMELGPGALMAKFDVTCAYWNILIHPEDLYLLGMQWRNRYYIDLTLPLVYARPHLFFNPSPAWWNGLSATAILISLPR